MTRWQEKRMEQLYCSLYVTMYRYAFLFLEDPLLSEEAVQECFRVACEKPWELFSSPNPEGWLMQTLKGVVSNAIRVRGRAQRVVERLSAEGEYAFAKDRLPLELLFGKVADTEEFRLLWEMAEGASVRELAQARGISEDACKKRIQRAKAYLRKKLEEF